MTTISQIIGLYPIAFIGLLVITVAILYNFYICTGYSKILIFFYIYIGIIGSSWFIYHTKLISVLLFSGIAFMVILSIWNQKPKYKRLEIKLRKLL